MMLIADFWRFKSLFFHLLGIGWQICGDRSAFVTKLMRYDELIVCGVGSGALMTRKVGRSFHLDNV
jgi:hypothetical protein